MFEINIYKPKLSICTVKCNLYLPFNIFSRTAICIFLNDSESLIQIELDHFSNRQKLDISSYYHMFLTTWTYAKYFIWTHIIALNIIYSKLFHTSKVCCCHLKLRMLWDYDKQNSTILYHGRAGWWILIVSR